MFALQVVLPPTGSFWWLAIVFFIIALMIIVVVGFLFAFPIAALAAIITYFLTGGSINSLTYNSLLDAGIVFLVVALISAVVGSLAGYGHHHHHDDDDHDD
jgi:hypothetical protein